MSDTLYTILEPGWVWLLAWPLVTAAVISALDAAGLIPTDPSEQEMAHATFGGTACATQTHPSEREV